MDPQGFKRSPTFSPQWETPRVRPQTAAHGAAPCEGRCRSVGTWDVSSPGGRRRKGPRLIPGRDLSLVFVGPGRGEKKIN